MKMFAKKAKQRTERNDYEAKKALTNMEHTQKYESKLPIIDWLNNKKVDSILQKIGALKP